MNKTFHVVVDVGCWECQEQTEILWVGDGDEAAALFAWGELVHSRGYTQGDYEGPNFDFEGQETTCIRHHGRMELHKVESIGLMSTTFGVSEARGPDTGASDPRPGRVRARTGSRDPRPDVR